MDILNTEDYLWDLIEQPLDKTNNNNAHESETYLSDYDLYSHLELALMNFDHSNTNLDDSYTQESIPRLNSPSTCSHSRSQSNTVLQSPLLENKKLQSTIDPLKNKKPSFASIDEDIFSYDYTSQQNVNIKHKVNKSSHTSPNNNSTARPPLKPSVTINSIETLNRINSDKKKVSLNVGNPFYKPINLKITK